jgi:hypothetical protein
MRINPKKLKTENTISPEFLFFQCDWEPVEADADGVPTEWAKFSRSSSMEDMEMGIKGREHKYLLRVLANMSGKEDIDDNIAVFSWKTLDEIKGDGQGIYSFSVVYGLRKKYWDTTNEEDLQAIIDNYKNYKGKKTEKEIRAFFKAQNKTGRIAYVKIPDQFKIYIKNIKEIKEKIGFGKIELSKDIFQKDPFWSFVGLVELSKYIYKNLNLKNKLINLFEEKLIEQLTVNPQIFKFDTTEERIEMAFNEDYGIKIKALKYLRKELLGSEETKQFDEDYEKWKNKKTADLIAKGGKLSIKDANI